MDNYMNDKRIFSLFMGYGDGFTFPFYQTVALEAEKLGFETIWTQDNITGHAPIPRDIEILDTWSFLSAIAATTSKVRVGSMATPVIRRSAPLLAKAIASIDMMSNGRVNVGLGTGDDVHQYEMIGQRFPDSIIERRQILKETIDVMKAMWNEELANYKGDHFQLKDAILSPKPIQKPNPPIYIACNTSKRLMPRIAAQQADALAIMWGHDETVIRVINAFQEEWETAGRPAEDYRALRSAFIVICDHDDEMKAKQEAKEITVNFHWDGHRQTASQAIVPKGSDPDLYIFGTPEKIANELQERVFDLGFNELMCSFVAGKNVEIDTGGFNGWPGHWLGGMRLFAEQIMPLLKN
jgi:alkanesulfonate monooxygenase SsuD/methylene tetrahydromethanopterin reductase-like flavin-dependent oxidoreductase (luciferase family)